MARHQRDYIVSIFNDLKGCYDRVCPVVNIIATRRMGLPKNINICHATTLRNMRHYICTGFGISDRYIQWANDNNAGGLGQDSGGASVSWYSHMLPLENAYETETGHGVEYTNPDNT